MKKQQIENNQLDKKYKNINREIHLIIEENNYLF